MGIDEVTLKISALGLYPIRISNGDCPVDSFFHELCAILPEVDNSASSFVDGPPRSISIVPTIDWTFPIVHLFLGDTLWTRSELSCNGHYNRTPDLGK